MLLMGPVLWTIDHISSIIRRYLPGFHTGTILYCLVTEVHVCEQLAQDRYLAAAWPGFEPATSCLQVRRPNHYSTKPHITL